MRRVPRSCSCGDIHGFGEHCPVSTQRASSLQRFGPGWSTISKRVIARDHGICQLGLPGCTQDATTTDHVVSRSVALSQGWGLSEINAESNLVAACRHCNSSKGA